MIIIFHLKPSRMRLQIITYTDILGPFEFIGKPIALFFLMHLILVISWICSHAEFQGLDDPLAVYTGD